MNNVIRLHENSVTEDTATTWQIDCAFGRKKAKSLVAQIRSNGDYPAGLAEIRALIGSEWSGAEVGFFQRLLELAVIGADARTQYPSRDQ